MSAALVKVAVAGSEEIVPVVSGVLRAPIEPVVPPVPAGP